MNKFVSLKKKLITEGVIAAVVIGIFAGGLFFVMGISADAIKAKSDMESQIRSTESQISTYQAQLSKTDEATNIFAEVLLVREGDQRFSLTRAQLLEELQILVQQYRLTVISSQITPLRQRTEGEFGTLKQMDFQTAEIEMEFDAITDQHVYNFIDELSRRFPGIMTINSLDVSLEREMSNNAYLQVHSGGVPKLVRAGFTATWTSIYPVETEEAAQ